MTSVALAPLAVPVLLSVIIAQQGFFYRRLFLHVRAQGGRLTRLECVHLRNNPDDFESLKIGGTD